MLTVTGSNDALVGIAPLYIRKRRILKGFTVNEIRFLGSGEDISPDYLDFIIERGRETEIIDALQVFLSSRNQWDVFNLTDMHSDSHSIALLAETARSGGFATSQSECAVCPYIQLPLSWTDYLGTLSANTRYNVKRRMKNVERDFNSRFFVWEDKKVVMTCSVFSLLGEDDERVQRYRALLNQGMY